MTLITASILTNKITALLDTNPVYLIIGGIVGLGLGFLISVLLKKITSMLTGITAGSGILMVILLTTMPLLILVILAFINPGMVLTCGAGAGLWLTVWGISRFLKK